MSTKPTTTIRIDSNIKRQANDVFDKIGISMSTAINTFLKTVVREGGIPFDIGLINNKNHLESKNATLNRAFIAKKDEFYTQYEDIAEEMIKHQKDFKGKVVFCNCDDPFESAFFRFFVINFEKFELAKLICTCYSGSSLPGQEYPLENRIDAYKASVTEVPSENLVRHDNSLDLELLFTMEGNSLEYLDGDGDFRSEECVILLNEADIIVTNPPFSLFREYISLLINYNKKFIILGNMNAVTYKEIFPLFRDNKIWYGDSIYSGDRKFYVPDSYPLNASGCGVDENGRRFIRVKGVRWITNLSTSRRKEFIKLNYNYVPEKYPTYDNYNAIEVGQTKNIPTDYNGFMGVPITFLDKYSPKQFDIIMLANGNARTNTASEILELVGYQQHLEDRGGVGMVNGKRAYARIIIRRKANGGE